jgi:hypothetical protein
MSLICLNFSEKKLTQRQKKQVELMFQRGIIFREIEVQINLNEPPQIYDLIDASNIQNGDEIIVNLPEYNLAAALLVHNLAVMNRQLWLCQFNAHPYKKGVYDLDAMIRIEGK